ncbi:MAG: hypothetical protein LBL04_00540 [Bacteroidales bacterium]|jgi:transcription elongation factor|nr:hypothetical protein [Bacteroidales bacterium]
MKGLNKIKDLEEELSYSSDEDSLIKHMAEKKDIPNHEIQEKRDILFSSLSFIYEKIDKPESIYQLGKTLKEGLLVGVSTNITKLISKSKEDFQTMFENLVSDVEFKDENLRQGLAKTDKVQSRLRKSISIFGI